MRSRHLSPGMPAIRSADPRQDELHSLGPSVARQPEASPSVCTTPQTTTGTYIRFADSLEQSRPHVRQKPVNSVPVPPRQPVAQPVVRVP